tara:strand:+ start:27 stop:134 length:108 start_codon:yes stop_codon:yes gene_type:complete
MILPKPEPKIHFREKIKPREKALPSNINCFLVNFI